jgi:LTXXQ motif family protein
MLIHDVHQVDPIPHPQNGVTIMTTKIRCATIAMSSLLMIGAITTTAEAQISAVVSGGARVGTGVTATVPLVTGQAQGATRATANGSMNGATNAGARPMTTSAAQVRQAVDAGTQTLLAGISLTAQQQARVEAYAESYAKELQASTDARVEATAEASTGAAQRAEGEAERRAEAREQAMRGRAAEYRAKVRSVLTSEQQTRFDANVQAGATAELNAGSGASAKAEGQGSAEASASHRSKAQAQSKSQR